MAPKPPKKKNGTPPPIDKLLIPAIGIALALLAYQFISGIKSDVSRKGGSRPAEDNSNSHNNSHTHTNITLAIRKAHPRQRP
jgi:hypothetical protein